MDFWGTMLRDGPGSDERYRVTRLTDFAVILAEAGHTVKRQHLDRAYDRSIESLGNLWSRGRDLTVEGHVRAVLDGVDGDLASRVSAEVLARLVDAYSRPALVVPPTVDEGTLGALEALGRRGYTLAVVSNTMRTPGVVLRQILDRYGLLGHFKHATFSDEVGIRKPDPEIFAMTLRAVGGDPDHAVHVGDDPILDVEGARAAGMRVIQVTRGPLDEAAIPAADAVIRGLSELPNAVATLDG